MSGLPAPWEDMRGSGRDRSGCLWLALDDDRQEKRLEVVRMAQRAYFTPGNPMLKRRILAPQVGDIVVETGVFFTTKRDGFDPLATDWYRGVGFLLTARKEWLHTDEEWAALLAEPDPFGYSHEDTRPAEHRAWYVQYGPQPVDICRWENADFYAVPTE